MSRHAHNYIIPDGHSSTAPKTTPSSLAIYSNTTINAYNLYNLYYISVNDRLCDNLLFGSQTIDL